MVIRKPTIVQTQIHYFCPMSDLFRYYYRAYGLSIASRIPIEGFEAITPEEPDIIVTEGKVPENLDNIVNKSELFQSNAREFLLKFDPVGIYYISNGQSITVQRKAGISDSYPIFLLLPASVSNLPRKPIPCKAEILFDMPGNICY